MVGTGKAPGMHWEYRPLPIPFITHDVSYVNLLVAQNREFSEPKSPTIRRPSASVAHPFNGRSTGAAAAKAARSSLPAAFIGSDSTWQTQRGRL